VVKIAALNVDFQGDCTGLINAANRSKAEIRSFDGLRATAAVSLTGASGVVSDLGKVQSAVGSAGGVVTVGMDTSGIAAGRAEISGAREDARAFGRDMDSLGGSRAFSLSDGGSVQQANRDLSGMRGTLRGASEDFQATSRAGSDAGSALQDSYGRVGSAAEGMGGEVEASTAKVEQHAMAMAGGGNSVTGANLSAAASFGNVQSALGKVGSTAALTQQQVQSVTGALNSGGLVQGLNAFNAAYSPGGGGPIVPNNSGIGRPTGQMRPGTQLYGGNGPPPPPVDPPGGGGGGGLFGEGSDNALTKAGGMLDSGASKLGMPAIMGAAIGMVEAIAPAAIGMLAMNAVVKDTPALAYASGKAMNQLADGIREGSQGATAAGVPGFQALGAALKPLGEEIGHIGASNMGQMLGAETSLAGGLTNTLKSLEPTISPAISAAENLGNAFLSGIASPDVAKGITATANALSTPAAAQAVSDITSAVLTGSSYLAQGGIQAITDLTGHGQGATNVGSGWKTQPVGETVAEHSGGMFAYDPGQDTGEAASTPLPGGGAGTTWNQDTGVGRWATAAGSTLHTAGLAARDFMNGSMLNGSAADELHAAGDDQAQRWGAATSGQAPAGSAVNPAGAQTLAASQAAAPHGYDQDPTTGALTPSAGPGGGGGWYPGGPGTGGSGVQSVQPPGLGAPPKPPTTAPMGGVGGGTSVGSLTPAQVQGLSAALPSLSQGLSQTGSSAQQLSSGLQNVPKSTQQVSQGLQQVSQSSQQLSAPMQQAAQHTQAATSAVQSLAAQAPQAVSAVQQVAPAASKALGEAAPVMQSGGASLGATASTAVASGISDNQQAACDASSKMANSAANCAKAALQIQSPSKIFQDLGVNVSTGLALGIQDATPQAVGAVQSAMSKVVAAGQAGLQTASPSKTFQTMGQQAMSNVGQGAQSVSEGAQLNNTLAQMNQAAMPRKALQDAQKKQQDQAKKDAEAQSPQAQADASFASQLQSMGYSPATQTRLEAQRKQHEAQQKKRQESQNKDHVDAMTRAGIQGILPTGADQGDSLLSPIAQYHKQQEAQRDALKGTAMDRLNKGLTSQDPAAVARREGTSQIGSQADQNSMAKGGDAMGQSFGKGMAGGINKSAGDPANSAGNAGQGAVDAVKKKTKTSSPSLVFSDIGSDLMSGLSNGITAGGPGVAASIGDTMSGALGAGVTVASNGVQSIASNAGLAVGYQWAQNVVTGADSVLKTADFQQISIPQLGSALAKTALGVDGLLGPAGSGGSIPNNLTVTMGAGTAAVPQPIVVNVLLDGQPFDQKIVTQITSAMGALADSIPQQVG
jgi:hypothetical protein